MTNSQRLAKVRASLLSWLADQAPRREIEAPTAGPALSPGPDQSGEDSSQESQPHSIERESILVRDDFFCGRRFYTGDHHAVWFMEEDQLKIYHNSGELLCTLSGGEIDDQAVSVTATESPTILRLPLPGDSTPGVVNEAPDSRDSTRRAA